MNKIVELQRKSAELTSDIEDILHAASINFQAILSEAQHPSIRPIHQEFAYLHSLLIQTQQLLKQRTPLFINYLITRQIQDEEARVRRERLTEYEEKIYDQKRIITDKETFFENLLRPKRKRPSYQTPEEFQETRLKEREAEEKLKSQQLTRDVSELQALKKMLETRLLLRKKGQLENTKSSSLSQVNVSLVGQPESATEKVIPFEDRTNHTNRSSHFRSCSMQHHKQTLDSKDNVLPDTINIKDLLIEVTNLKNKNQELQNIHDQAVLSLNFKKGQCCRIQAEYNEGVQEIALVRKKLIEVERESRWRGERVFSPVGVGGKRSGSR